MIQNISGYASAHFVGYALFRRQFGCGPSICQTNTLEPANLYSNWTIHNSFYFFLLSIIANSCQYFYPICQSDKLKLADLYSSDWTIRI